MASKKIRKSKKKKEKTFDDLILEAVNNAIAFAADDTGLDPKNYGMLESRIEWYLDIETYDLNIKVDFVFNRETFQVEIHKITKYGPLPIKEDE